jgi:hypothetical protein
MSKEWEKSLIEGMTAEQIEDYRFRVTSLMEEVLTDLEVRHEDLSDEEFQLYKALLPLKKNDDVFKSTFTKLGIALYLQQIYITEYENSICQRWLKNPSQFETPKSDSKSNALPPNDLDSTPNKKD